jgi:hypothetical protein
MDDNPNEQLPEDVPGVGDWLVRKIEGDPLRVSCYVSGRWLQFTGGAHYESMEKDDLVALDVMTLDQNDRPRKLCELVLYRGDLLRALEAIPRGSTRGG